MLTDLRAEIRCPTVILSDSAHRAIIGRQLKRTMKSAWHTKAPSTPAWPSRQPSVEKAAAIDPQKVQAAKVFYENAVASGKGGTAAPVRVQLMQRILDLQKN